MPQLSIAEQAEVIARSRDWRLAPTVSLAQIDEAVKQATTLEDFLRRLKELLH